MALTSRSVTSAARRRAERAYRKLKAAQLELAAVNAALRETPRINSPEVASAASRTVQAERHVQEAGKELQMIAELLEEESAPSQILTGASGEGLDSLLPHLRNRRNQKP